MHMSGRALMAATCGMEMASSRRNTSGGVGVGPDEQHIPAGDASMDTHEAVSSSSSSIPSSSEDDDHDSFKRSALSGPRVAEKVLVRHEALEHHNPAPGACTRTLRRPRLASTLPKNWPAYDDEGVDSPEGGVGAKRGRRETLPDIANRIPVDALRPFLRVSLVAAAKALGISATTLKRLCRHYGIKRWPYRQISGIDRTVNRLEAELEASLQRSPTSRIRDPIVAHIRELQLHRQGMVELALEGGHEPIRGKLASVGAFVDNLRDNREMIGANSTPPAAAGGMAESPTGVGYPHPYGPNGVSTTMAAGALPVYAMTKTEYGTPYAGSPFYHDGGGGGGQFGGFHAPIVSHDSHGPQPGSPGTTDRLTPPPPSPSLAEAVAAAAAAAAVSLDSDVVAAQGCPSSTGNDIGNQAVTSPVQLSAPSGRAGFYGGGVADQTGTFPQARKTWPRSFEYGGELAGAREGCGGGDGDGRGKAHLPSMQFPGAAWEEGTPRDWNVVSAAPGGDGRHSLPYLPPGQSRQYHDYQQQQQQQQQYQRETHSNHHAPLAVPLPGQWPADSPCAATATNPASCAPQQYFGGVPPYAGAKAGCATGAGVGRSGGGGVGGGGGDASGGPSIDMTAEDVHALGELVFGNPENYAAATAAHAASSSGIDETGGGGNGGYGGASSGTTGLEVPTWKARTDEAARFAAEPRRDVSQWNNRACLL